MFFICIVYPVDSQVIDSAISGAATTILSGYCCFVMLANFSLFCLSSILNNPTSMILYL
jgi:hypothetical protein